MKDIFLNFSITIEIKNRECINEILTKIMMLNITIELFPKEKEENVEKISTE